MWAKADLKLKATNFKMTLMVQLSLTGEQDSSSFSVHLLQAKANLNLKATNFKMSRIPVALVYNYCELKLT